MRYPIQISSITAFIEHIEQHCQQDNTLFRGQPGKHDLLPAVGRKDFRPRHSRETSERQMLADFKAVAIPFLTARPDSVLEWLALAQHHGMSTRLLDWTTNPLAALWFAIRSAAPDHEAADVWYFLPEPRDTAGTEAEQSPLNVSRCQVYRPAHISSRIVRQSGWFTLHAATAGGDFCPLNEDADFASRLTRLRVPQTGFSQIRYSLDRYGAHEATFMPDLPGVAAYVDWCHRQLEDECPDDRDSMVAAPRAPNADESTLTNAERRS